MLSTFRTIVEYFAGEQDHLPMGFSGLWVNVLRSAVWAFSILLIYAFCGQSSKFIYIDF